jgi:hypothetical protein
MVSMGKDKKNITGLQFSLKVKIFFIFEVS